MKVYLAAVWLTSTVKKGNNGKIIKNGVVKMIIPIGTSSFLCTGSILNNTKEDLKPYLLTAFHCLLSSKEQASASDLSQAQFFFRYENTTCGSNTPTSPVSMIGCTYIAGVPLENGVDGALLLLKGKIPDNLNAYYNGWDRRNIAPQSGVCIHHPQGDVKKISTYDRPAGARTLGNPDRRKGCRTDTGTLYSRVLPTDMV